MRKISCKISDDEIMHYMDVLMTQLNIFATGGSGWVVKTLSRLEIKSISHERFIRSFYIETAALLKRLKRSFSNVVNKRDTFCCLCCIAAALFFFTGKPFPSNSHKKTSGSCVLTQSSCQCLYSFITRSRNVIIVPLTWSTGEYQVSVSVSQPKPKGQVQK